LPGHVRAGDEGERVVVGEAAVVGDELGAELLLEDGVLAVDDLQDALGDDGRAAVAALGGEGGEG
jgi:hypothetical protein